ncbi:MAG: PQQ-dependent sugar dehydrogenase [Chthoniobacter sp.]|nr:PQQ-dependent sugar dehydrogenase [Chthoniobacter sp.]
MKTILAATISATLAATTFSAPAADAPPDYRFHVERLAEGLAQPMAVAVAPDGRIFFNEYGGKLKIYQPKTKSLVLAGELKVFRDQENGFLAFALDPKFAENHWIYCLYSPPGFDGQYLSRFTMEGDTLDLASEKRLLQYDEQRKQCCHHGSTLAFAPDGCLLWSAGDNTHPHAESNGYGPLDERPDRAPWDAQKSSANTMSLAGKICRIRPKPDGTYEIPAGNLFPPGTPKTRPEIYVMGCRNPWRMSVDAKTGYVYWGEVGPDANDDGPRGPRGYDEINQAKKAGNFGWPYFVGDNFAYTDYDYVTKQLGQPFDPLHPINESVNNTGIRELPPAMPAFLYWPYRAPKKWPEFGEGGRTACAGPVFHWRPEFAKSGGFPQHFDNCLLFWDWERPFMKWARLDADSNLAGLEPFTGAVQVSRGKPVASGATNVKRPVHAVFGQDGQLYLLDYGDTWGANADSQLLKISYVTGNLAPVARVQPDFVVVGDPAADAPTLSAETSRDPEGGALTYQWTLQPGGKTLGNTAQIPVTIKEPGNYVAEVRVTDAQGTSSTASARVIVGNRPPKVTFIEPKEGDTYAPGQPVKFRIAVSDPEDGESAAKAEVMGARVVVSGAFRRDDGKEDPLDPGITRMKQSDCFNCHAAEQKVVGPSLVEIANKYRGQSGAMELLTKKVREGGSGVWGPIPMLPHPQLTDDEVAIMLRWLLSLEAGKGGPILLHGLTGEAATPNPGKPKPGVFVLEATYTDQGHAPAGELSGRATITLRPR